MSERPYHKYVFDVRNRAFVGNFEEMYRREDLEGYDSWGQEDLQSLEKQLSLAVRHRQLPCVRTRNDADRHAPEPFRAGRGFRGGA